MKPELTARWAALPEHSQSCLEQIVEDTLSAMEHEATAVLIVDTTGTGKASMLHVGHPQNVLNVIRAAVEALGELSAPMPEGEVLQ